MPETKTAPQECSFLRREHPRDGGANFPAPAEPPRSQRSLPRHIFQLLYQKIGKHPDLGCEMPAAAVGDKDTGLRHAGPVQQERNEVALLDAIVAEIAGDQSDAAIAQCRF